MLKWGGGEPYEEGADSALRTGDSIVDAINQLYLTKVGFTAIDSSDSTSITVSKNVDDIQTEVDDIQTEIGTGTLSTTSQNLIGAINEINGGLSALFSEFVVGDSNGRVKLSNGLIIQWGKTSWLDDTTSTIITFPISFSSTPTVFITSWKQSRQALATGSIYDVSASSFSLYHSGASSSAGSSYSWIAIGI